MSDHSVGQCPITCPITETQPMFDNPNARIALQMLHFLTDEQRIARLGMTVEAFKALSPEERTQAITRLSLAALQKLGGEQ